MIDLRHQQGGDFLMSNQAQSRFKMANHYLADNRNVPFYLGGFMETKICRTRRKTCTTCKQEKPITEFYQCKSGRNKGNFISYCKNCCKKIIWKPWIKTYRHIEARCYYDKKSSYFGRIKNFLKIKDLKYLWFRDKAWLLEKASIDRKDNKGHYTLENCRYIELRENLRRKG